MQRVRGKLGRVALCGAEAAQRARYLSRTDTSGREQRRAVDQADSCAPRRHRGATPGCVESGVDDPSLRIASIDSDRDAHEVAACGSARRAGERVRWDVPAPTRSLQVVGEHFERRHALSVSACGEL